jgi:biopolymer transport protein ExbB/TolQ
MTIVRGILLVGTVLAALAALAVLAGDTAWAQDSPIADSRLAQMTDAEPEEYEEIVVTESVGAFIAKGKPIGDVILVLLVFAVFLVVDQLRVHLLERVRARKLRKVKTVNMRREEFEELARESGRSRLGKLLVETADVYRQTGDLSLLSTEAEVYREREEHRFNTFEARMSFLADTAGGLGLLGTVWGIYRGFAAKAVAQTNEELLAAMGVALVTTFLGIVVSVIINWMSTETGAAVRGRIMSAIGRVDDYRELLIRELGNRAA